MGAAVLLAAALGLAAGCGFQPLYGEESGAGAAESGVVEELRHVYVPPIEDRVGQLVRIELTNRLVRRGSAPTPRYRLDVTLTESKANVAVRADASATRTDFDIVASYALLPSAAASDAEPLASGTVRSSSSYDLLENDFATLAAEADARRRAARDIAIAILDRLAIRFRAARGDGTS